MVNKTNVTLLKEMRVEKIGLETDDSAIRGEIRNLEEKKLTSLFIHTKKSAAALRTTAEKEVIIGDILI